MELKNKVIVVTGGSRGLGKEMARIFLREGARVVINSIDKRELEETTQELSVKGIYGDVTKKEDLISLFDFTIKEYGQIDIWVNNAGRWLPYSSIEELDSGKVHDIFEVNFFGTLYGVQAVLPYFKKKKSGIILNIISVSALEGRAHSSAYCASKFAQDGFSKSLREEVRPFNIQVLLSYPGKMNTGLYDEGRLSDYGTYMDPAKVAELIVNNLQVESPLEEQIIKKID